MFDDFLEMISVGQVLGALLLFWAGRRIYKVQVLHQNKNVATTVGLIAFGLWLIVTRIVR